MQQGQSSPPCMRRVSESTAHSSSEGIGGGQAGTPGSAPSLGSLSHSPSFRGWVGLKGPSWRVKKARLSASWLCSRALKGQEALPGAGALGSSLTQGWVPRLFLSTQFPSLGPMSLSSVLGLYPHARESQGPQPPSLGSLQTRSPLPLQFQGSLGPTQARRLSRTGDCSVHPSV